MIVVEEEMEVTEHGEEPQQEGEQEAAATSKVPEGNNENRPESS